MSEALCRVTNLPATLDPTIRQLFPEGAHPDPVMVRPDVYVTVTQDNTNISFTYISSVCGYVNRLGFARYNKNTHSMIPGSTAFVWPRINNSNGGCLLIGDTFKFGTFNNGDVVMFFLDPQRNASDRFWSYIDDPWFVNPESTLADIRVTQLAGKCGCTSGYIHGTWAYLVAEDITVFGFEDSSLGDADYNDLTFFLQYEGGLDYNEIVPWDNDTLKICNFDTLVSRLSYASINCTQWGLLEATQSTRYCLSYLAIPTGWKWAEASDPAARAAVSLLGRGLWADFGAQCFLLSTGPASGIGITPSGAECDPLTYTIKTIWNATASPPQYCYNAACSSRFVLRGADLVGDACTSVGLCDPSSPGYILNTNPTTSNGASQFPKQFNVWLRAPPSGFVEIASTFNFTSPRKIDVLHVVDTGYMSRSDSDRNSIIGDFKSITGRSEWNGFDDRHGLAVWRQKSNQWGMRTDYSWRTDTDFTTWGTYLWDGYSNGGGCPSTNGDMIGNLIPLLSEFSWRQDAYHVLFITGMCSVPLPDSTRDNFVTKVKELGLHVYFLSPNNDNPAYHSTLASRVPNGKTAKVGNRDRWNTTPWKDQKFNWMTEVVDTLRLYSISDPHDVLALPSDTKQVSNGLGSIALTVRWPAGFTLNPAVESYSARYGALGRSYTDVTIRFNRRPVMPGVSLPVNAGQATTITFTPTDPDGDLMRLTVISLPTRGVLKRADTGAQLNAGDSLPDGTYALIYQAHPQASAGSDSWTMGVTDGCLESSAVASVTISAVNTPPVAQDFYIDMLEDSLPTSNNGRIDFSGKFTDPDVGQTHTFRLTSLPSSLGGLTQWQPNSAGASITTFGEVPSLIRFVLNQPSGYGNVTFRYRVNDGIADSNEASVEVRVWHVNHPPTLVIPVRRYTVSGVTSADQPISATINDVDGILDTVNMRVVSSNLSTFSIKTGSRTYPTGTLPYAMFASNFGPSPSSGIVFPVASFSWNPNGAATGLTEAVTLEAIDNSGATSNTIELIFSSTDLNPPTWQEKPAAGGYSIAQGTSQVDIPFTAHDIDPIDYQSLVFTMVEGPSQGVVELQSLTGTAFYPISVNTPIGPAISPAQTFSLDAGAKTARFEVRYTPPTNFHGTVSFTFTVRDATNLYAADGATATITVTRADTPPISDDSELRGKEQEFIQTNIPASSTNPGTNPVLLELVSLDFPGTLYLDSAKTTVWSVGSNTSATTTGSISVWAQGLLGFYSPDPATPIGTFNYRAVEPTSGAPFSSLYTGRIYLTHVNHPPESQGRSDTIKKREVLRIELAGTDRDAGDTVRIAIRSITGKGKFYRDAALSQEIDGNYIASGGDLGFARVMWYQANDDFSGPSTAHAEYTFIAVDNWGLPSESTYLGTIFVLPAGDPPTFGGALEVTTFQETPVPMILKSNVVTETGQGVIVRVITKPQRGQSFLLCDEVNLCLPAPTTLPPEGAEVTSPNGRVMFTPQDYDWDSNFTSFQFTLTDVGSGAVGTFTMTIHVIHVNKRPFIEASNFLTTAETTEGIIVNESTTHVFRWRAWDVDSLPSTLGTQIRISFYTTGGFNLYSCAGAASSWADDAECTFDPQVPFGSRADFTKNAKKLFGSYSSVTQVCPDFNALKAGLGQLDHTKCEARFKLSFAPTPGASYTPYIAINLASSDDYQEESTPISVLIYVKALNDPPTIYAPPRVLATSGITNPFIRNTDQDSAEYNNPVIVFDSDANGNPELLTIQVNDGSSGNLIWPSSAPCWVDADNSQLWYCLDRIPQFKLWLQDLRFEVTSGSKAELTFTINDLGHTSDWQPSPNLTASATTLIQLTAGVPPPKGSSSTLAIAVGVAAAAGLLLLGALGFFLRKAVAPPKDDYFSAATTPLSAAPQSPLYKAQNETFTSALYKAKT